MASAESQKLKVLLLRSESSGPDKYVSVLHGNGCDVYTVPTLDFVYQNTDNLLEQLNAPSSYSGIVFTSPRAVLATSEVMGDHHKVQWMKKMCFVVGERTGSLVREKFGFNHTGSDSGDASGLADKIVTMMTGQNLPLLFPCGNMKKETLPKKLKEAGIQLHSCTVYVTQEHPDLKRKLEEYLALKPDFVVYFSPSGVSFSHLVLKQSDCFESIKHVSIGPTTRDALEKSGIQVFASAEKPCPDAVLLAIRGS
ncbi:uroporphyrinogen-III synthase-like [Amphibalanus amphitrite]|uniref:uroporphyrinogen-III synthase-like n=1 Tax=Amphibalanus amphitrite TaxID=1232801 RepID=UPI001C90C519|nr:uroporphyrinogen-III synthase-like [Amphibalanus amphitrite]